MEEEKLIIDEKEIKKRKKKKKNKINKWFYTFVVLDILAVIGLFVVYGPWDGFRNLWITSYTKTSTPCYASWGSKSTETGQSSCQENIFTCDTGHNGPDYSGSRCAAFGKGRQKHQKQ